MKAGRIPVELYRMVALDVLLNLVHGGALGAES
jgi:hypothetical protein